MNFIPINYLTDPLTIPDDWYEEIFDERYVEIDILRNPVRKTEAEVVWIEKNLNIKPPLKILDLCCGYGRHALEFSRKGYDVIGLDKSSILLNIAKAEAFKRNLDIQWILSDIREMPINRYDLVISMHTSFGYLPDIKDDIEILKKLNMCLNNKGVFLLVHIDLKRIKNSNSMSEIIKLNDGTSFRKISRFLKDENFTFWFGIYHYNRINKHESLPFRIRIYNEVFLHNLLSDIGFTTIYSRNIEEISKGMWSVPFVAHIAIKE